MISLKKAQGKAEVCLDKKKPRIVQLLSLLESSWVLVKSYEAPLRTQLFEQVSSMSTASESSIYIATVRSHLQPFQDLIGHDRDPAIYEYLQNRGVPSLSAWIYAPDSDRPTVGFDNRASMARLAETVTSMGHRKIGVISGISEGNDRARDRLAGIRDGLAKAGIARDSVTVIETIYEIESGAAACEQLLSQDDRPTAIMCGNDVLAVGAIRKAHALGLSVPGDISITGFDDIELARIVDPQLTTMHVPHREMGRRAAAALIEMVEKRSTGGSVELQSTLQLRESLGPPKT